MNDHDHTPGLANQDTLSETTSTEETGLKAQTAGHGAALQSTPVQQAEFHVPGLHLLRHSAAQISTSILALEGRGAAQLLEGQATPALWREELAASLALLRATIESTADAIVVLGLDGTVIVYNTKFANMWQFPDDLLRRRNGAEMRDYGAQQLKDPDGFLQLVKEQLAAPEQETFHLIEFKDGRTFERYGFPQWFQGECGGVVLNYRDITARQAAETANRLKDEFLATLSHELRTPLNAILGWARMLNDRRLGDEDRTTAVEAIQRNAQLQAQLIEDILDVSRIITGKVHLEVRPIELASVVEAAVEAAVESVLPSAQAKNIRLQRVLDSGSSLVSGDPNRLQQVVWNLVANAIKFTPKEGRVQVRLERVNSHVEIIVTDTGAGIAPEVLPYIFERFRQADSTSTRQHGGLGLGLSIVRHLVELHGGTVEAESAGEAQGATFTVRLPLVALRSVEVLPEQRQERKHPTGSQAVPFASPTELEGLHVLVVDDEADARTLVTRVLQRCGATVTAVDSAGAALQVLQEQRPHVLLSDVGMPGEDGYSLIKKVRALPAAQGGKTPAAALTAHARVEDRMRCCALAFRFICPSPLNRLNWWRWWPVWSRGMATAKVWSAIAHQPSVTNRVLSRGVKPCSGLYSPARAMLHYAT
ncbi:MAG: response regulator [Abitibacteriaceae bacterium]|nr:response regulator [Abditibacteriaceae bacterium]